MVRMRQKNEIFILETEGARLLWSIFMLWSCLFILVSCTSPRFTLLNFLLLPTPLSVCLSLRTRPPGGGQAARFLRLGSFSL